MASRATRKLSPREQQVLEMAADGLTAAQIANRLGVCERTVNTHIEHMRHKLGAYSRTHAVAIGFRIGLLE